MAVFAPKQFLGNIESENSATLLLALKNLCFLHPSAVMITDKDDLIVEINPAFEKITGFKRDEVIGQSPTICKSDKHPASFYQDIQDQVLEKNHWEGKVWDCRKNKSIYPKWMRIDRLVDEHNQTLFYTAVFHSMSDGCHDDVVEQLLYYDSLTGLPNRELFRHHLEHELQVSDRYDRRAGVMLINIDRFRQVNEGFGYGAGDDLLIAVSKRLESCVRRTDLIAKSEQEDGRKTDSISRFGGDEFSFILSDLIKGESAAIVAERVHEVFEEPYDLNGETLYLNASVGIAIYPDNGSTINDLMRCAENALSRSKRDGGNEYTFFSESMNRNAAERIRMESDIRQAVKADDFEVYYQPKVDISTGVINGMEALLRWPQADGSVMGPNQFIPLTEETGQIMPIGTWVLEQACKDILAINLEYGKYLKVAVNISPKQFRQTGFLETVRSIVAKSGCDPTFLELEITESMVMEDVEIAIETMKEIRNIGISLSMDDFGTGYSSLAYLRQFPLDALKIDRSFVCGMMDSSADTSIVAAICSIGRNLGLDVIAEGVENDYEVPLLEEMGCTMIQGYLYGKPMPIAEFRKTFLKKNLA